MQSFFPSEPMPRLRNLGASGRALLKPALPSAKEDLAVITMDIHMRLVCELEDAYWQVHFPAAKYYVTGRGYDQYRPAYELGWTSALQNPDLDFADLRHRMELQWEAQSAASLLPWREVADAVQDAWQHAREQMQQLMQTRTSVLQGPEIEGLVQPLYRACVVLAEDLEHMSQVPMSDFSKQVLQRHIHLIRGYAADLDGLFGARLQVQQPSLYASWPRRLQRHWLKFKSGVAQWAPSQVFEVCEMRERTLLSAYERILRKTLPVDVSECLQRHAKLLRNNMTKLSWVRHNWSL